MHYLTEHDKEKHLKYLERIKSLFQLASFNDREFPRCVFDDRAKETFMMCVGYIVGIWKSGSIDFAAWLSYNLINEVENLCHKSRDTVDQSMLAFVHTDVCNMSFAFGLYYQLPDGVDWNSEIVQKTHKLRAVREYKRRHWALYYNGGVIFCAGGRRSHTLDVGVDAWSTHT